MVQYIADEEFRVSLMLELRHQMIIECSGRHSLHAWPSDGLVFLYFLVKIIAIRPSVTIVPDGMLLLALSSAVKFRSPWAILHACELLGLNTYHFPIHIS